MKSLLTLTASLGLMLLAGTPTFPATITSSPPSGAPRTGLTVSGQVGRNAPGVRILWEQEGLTRGLTEGTVAPSGGFSLSSFVPADAQPGAANLGVMELGTDGSAISWTRFQVLAPDPARVAGQVLDAANSAVPGIKVHFKDEFGLPVAETTADARGNFAFAGVPPGGFILLVDAPRYPPTSGAVESGANLQVVAKPSTDLGTIPPLYLTSVGAIALPGGVYSSSSPAQVGDRFSPIFARLVSLQGKSVAPLNVRFWIELTPGTLPPGSPLVLVFQLLKNGIEVANKSTASKQQVFNSIPYNFQAYTVEFNSFDFTPGNLKLRITAVGVGFVQLGQWEFPVHVADLGSRWYAGYVNGPKLNVTREDFYNVKYQFDGTLPPSSVSFNQPIHLGLVTLENTFTLGVPIKERYFTTGAWSGDASASAVLKMLGIDFINAVVPYSGPSGSDLPASTYVLPTQHVDLTGKYCEPIPGLGISAYKCIKLCLIGCKKCAGLKLGAFFCIQGFVDFNSQIKKDLKVTALASPGITVSAPIEAVFDIIVCHASASIEPSATAKVPI